jgi:parallel beta-helix repeat protein
MNRFKGLFLRLIIAFFIVICAFIVINIYLSQPTEAETYVGGIINASTTWGSSGSPYVVTEDLYVNQGVNLSIEPDVLVKFDESIKMEVEGILYAIGNESKTIVFTGNWESSTQQSWNGIRVNNGGEVYLENCEISEAYYGLYLNESTGNSEISYTIFNNISYALWAYGVSDIELNNAVFSEGIFGIYLFDTKNITIHNLTVFNYSHGFYISYSQHISLYDCVVYNCSEGIELSHSSKNIISNNRIFNNENGIELASESYDNRISLCNITYNRYGIQISGGSRGCNVSNCEITNNENGVQLVNSRTNEVYNNNIFRNTGCGIRVYSSPDMGQIIRCNISMNREGISLTGAKHGNISHNTLWDNQYAIAIGMSSEYNTISRNDIVSSSIGISFSTHTRYNRIHHNNFIESSQHAKGPYSNLAIENYWNASGEGNYWDDYDGRDINGDNIGDSSHVVASYSVDYFPLIFPYNGTIPPDTIPPYFINIPSIASRNLIIPWETLDLDFMSSERGHYEIIIDTDGVEGFDNTTDTTLTNRTWAYSQTVRWTGVDNEGDYIVDGEYGIQINLWDLNGIQMDEPFNLGTVNFLIDRDSDGVLDINDPFPDNPMETIDTDGDGIGNNADTDDDNDGYSDEVELREGFDTLSNLSVPLDFDQDFDPDSTDPDDDNDGYADEKDEYPHNRDEWRDSDGDGIGDNADPDYNGNNIPDIAEIPLVILVLIIPLLVFYFLNKHVRAKKEALEKEEEEKKEEN